MKKIPLDDYLVYKRTQHFDRFLLPINTLEEDSAQVDRIKRKIEKTKEVLKICDDLDVDVISLHCKTNRLSRTLNFPFGVTRSLFCEGEDPNEHRQKAWVIAERCGIYGGCGNGGQAQIEDDSCVSGVYFKEDGEWYVEFD